MKEAWNYISLDEFAKIRAIVNDSGRSTEEKQISLAALLQGVDEDTILNLPLAQVQPIFARAMELNEQPQKARPKKVYQVAGWTLRLTEGKDISVAQWVDFQNYGKDMDNHLADMLSVVLVPKGKTYNEGYDIDRLKADLGACMSVPEALGVCFFFRRKWLKSMRRTLNFLVGWTLMKGQKELRRKAMKLQREVSDMLRSL